MCGGNKGQSTTSQTQTYTPNAQAAGYITDALGRAQTAANQGFNLPVAPVAGFSQDQQNAFNTVRNAQGMAQPYLNQAQGYFQQSATPNVSQFFNPYAGAVTDQLKNIFGQQQAQTTGQLTQAAGGVGADRIAVGQANLANQQGLAAGQTMAGLYAPALQAAQQEQNILQGAGYGTASLGAQAQNLALQGAQAQLGTGGLQQQLQQAQMNAPYQWQVAQSQFPYQQAQWYGNLVGALAPGLGGTTAGQGTATPAQPSIWSQILGAGMTGLGAYQGFTNSVGNMPATGAGAPSDAVSNAYALSQGINPYASRGGRINPYADGGEVPDKPIDIAAQPFISAGKTTPIQPHIPQLNLNPPQQGGGSGGSSGGGLGDIIGAAAKIVPFLARGGAVDMKKFDGHDPYTFFQSRFPKGYADGGSPTDEEREAGTDILRQAMIDKGYVPEQQPIRLATPEQNAAWRRGVDADRSLGQTAQGSDTSLPPIITQGTQGAAPTRALGFAPTSANPYATPSTAADTTSATTAPQATNVLGPAPGHAHDRSGFVDSPWAALMAAGLGIMGGTSPFAGVNIGQGGMQGLKMLEQQREAQRKDETTEQAARRLEQEAKFHEDQYTQATPYQKFEMSKPFPMGQRVDPLTGQTVTTYGVRQPDGSIKPVDPTAAASNPEQAAADDAAIPANAKATQGFLVPGKNVPDNVDPSALAGQDPGVANMVRAIDEGRQSLTQVPMKQRFMVERLLHAYDPTWDGTVWSARNRQQSDLSSNGNAGKLLLATNQLLPHLLTASEKAINLANSSYPEANTIKNWWLTATGDERVKEFQTVREVAAMDAARLLRGTGAMAEKDIEEWRKNIAESGSPRQLQGVIKMLADDLVGARIDSIKGLYKMNMRQEPPEFLWESSKAALEKIKANYAAINKPQGAAAPATAQPSASAAPAAANPPQIGEVRTNAHGVKGRWNGTGWEIIQ